LLAFSKIYERIIIRIYKDKLISFFGANQHAFRPTASTTTAITYYHDIVSKFLDSNCKGVRIIAFDLAKAFDSVNHDLLIEKIASDIGIPLALLIQNYLSDRTGIVTIKGFLGKSFNATSGIPQGSVIGPFLFNFFMGSLINCFISTFSSDLYSIVLYADDIIVIEKVLDYDNHISSVNFILNWFSNNSLICNNSKSFQSFYPKNRLHQADHPFLNNFEGIPYVSDFKYLGVIFSCNSTFSNYVDSIVCKVSKRIYVIYDL